MAVRKKTPVITSQRTTSKKSTPKRLVVAKKTVAKSTRSNHSSVVSRNTRPSQKTAVSANVTSQAVSPVYLKNPRLWVGAAVVILALLAFLYKGLFVAALVNGQPISRLSVINQLEKQNGKQALDNLVVESLVMQEAQRRNITVSQSDIDSQLKKIEDQLKAQGVTMQSALAARGLTQADLVNQIKLQQFLNKMVGASVKVTDSDVQSYIDKNQDTLPQNLSDADLRNQVKTQLEQQQLQDKTQAFVADLQKKAKITYFVSY